MKFFMFLIIITIILCILNEIWPYLLGIAAFILGTYLLWKLYEHCYFNSQNFKAIKQRIATYAKSCNELNEHIESLKDTTLISNKVDYGDATYHDSSKWNYQRKYLKDQKYEPNVHQCSRSVCDNARKKPFEYVCKYFGIKANEETLSNFETILNNFEAAEEGKQNLKAEKDSIFKSIETEIPFLIRTIGKRKLEKNLGFKPIDMSTAYFPKYIFEYVSSGGNASTQCEVVMNIENLNKFIQFLSEKIKFSKSVAGQRALMTSKLRQHIKERDKFTCRQCGISIAQEPHLLLEIDHIIPVSKGGLTVEDNLQTLCWRCNRSKGSKVASES